MPKPITIEMIEAMSPDQLKNLKANAQNRDTPASKAVLELIAEAAEKNPAPTAKPPSAPRKKAAAKKPVPAAASEDDAPPPWDE